MCFLVSWPHSSWTGPLEVSSPTLAPARPTSKPDQVPGILSRGVLSICKDRDLIPSPDILLQGLTTFIGGGGGAGWEGISLAPTCDHRFWYSHHVLLRRIWLSSLQPPLTLAIVTASHRVLLQAGNAPRASCAPALGHHSSPLLSSLSPVLGGTQLDTVPDVALNDGQQGKNTFIGLLANSCLTPRVVGLHHHKDVLLPCLPACVLLQSWSPADPGLCT